MAGDVRAEGAMRVADELVDALERAALSRYDPAAWDFTMQVHYTVGFFLGDDLDVWRARREARLTDPAGVG